MYHRISSSLDTRYRTHRRNKCCQEPRLRTLGSVSRNSTVLKTFFVIAIYVAFWLYQLVPSLVISSVSLPNETSSLTGGGYEHFLDIALGLASLEPSEVLASLEQNDPFKTNRFDALLLQNETALNRTLTIEEIKDIFPCPRLDERITLPDARVEQKAKDFRDGKHGTFLFFQHLRKAGGTNFCSLAENNLPKKAQPHYYCMPDKGWKEIEGAGYLHSWSNEEIITRMAEQGFRIAGNEWENFDLSRHFDLPAVFATSFRKPLDRALSQFRFECVEDRGCYIKDVRKWWKHRKDLWNVYTKTFADPPGGARNHFKGSEHSKQRREMMARAIDTLSKFHIVLSMEWLAYAAPQVKSILGFNDVSALTTRVRPHISEATRDDGQEHNNLGSASIKKASWDPKEYLDAAQYKKMSEDLALDEILTEVARRMFLERLVCEDLGGGIPI
ncbi:hypothetical protein ACHAWT_010690 [Skeletonema menzelii]|eukprot:scaffold7636_cov145-Skeletonema_menzelii.AAC.3